jgi:hypothetical protein
MDLPEIGSVGFGDIAGDIIRNAQIRRNAAAFVAIETELLVMAVCAVPAGTAGKEAVLTHLIGTVGRRNARSLVAVRAFFQAHGRKIFVGKLARHEPPCRGA